MPKTGGKYCVAGFSKQRPCKNSSYSEGISMHMFPQDQNQCDAWTKFVRRHRPSWNPTTSSALGSTHFCANDFIRRPDITVLPASVRSPRKILSKSYIKPGTVPTVDDYDIASKSFASGRESEKCPAMQSTNLPTLQTPDTKLKREVTCPRSPKQRKITNNSDTNELLTESTSAESESQVNVVFVPEPHVHGNTKNTIQEVENKCFEYVDELRACKQKLKVAQQKCSNYRRTIRLYQQKVKSLKSSVNSCSGDLSSSVTNTQSSEVTNLNYLEEKLEGNISVDASELDEYLEEADEMSVPEDDPNWEIEEGLDLDSDECTLNDDKDSQIRFVTWLIIVSSL